MKTNRWTTKALEVTAVGAALDVSGGNTIFSITGSSSGRTITSLSGGGAGQWVILVFGDGNVTVTTAAAGLKGAVNFVGASGDTLWLATYNGTTWHEVARKEVAGDSGPMFPTTITASSLVTLLGAAFTSTAKTATADGTGTGTIAANESWITAANGGDANNIITLPAPTPGRIVVIVTTGALEVRSSDPATVAINGGTGATAESAIPSGAATVWLCASATAWLAFQMASNGDLTKVEVAA